MPAAVSALRHWQAQVAASCPGLELRLFVRHEPHQTTLMEVHALPGSAAGIDDALQALLCEQGDVTTQAYRQGPRHLEVFEPLD